MVTEQVASAKLYSFEDFKQKGCFKSPPCMAPKPHVLIDLDNPEKPRVQFHGVAQARHVDAALGCYLALGEVLLSLRKSSR